MKKTCYSIWSIFGSQVTQSDNWRAQFKFQVSTLLLLRLVGIGGFRVAELLFEGHLADICQPISDRIGLTVNVGLRKGNAGQLPLPIFLERQMNKHIAGFLIRRRPTRSFVLYLIDSTPLNPFKKKKKKKNYSSLYVTYYYHNLIDQQQNYIFPLNLDMHNITMHFIVQV